MDEPTKTGQDTPSGKPGQSSGKKGGSTSEDKGKLYKVADIDKIKSDAAAEAGRLRKAAEEERDIFKQDLESTKSRLDALDAQAKESRAAQARGDPAAMRLFHREEAIEKRERDVETKERDNTRREGQIKADREAIDADKSVFSVAYIAAKHGLEPERLEKLGIKDPEALEKVAEELAAGAKPKGEGEDALREEYEALGSDAEKEAFVEAHPGFSAEGGEFHADSGDDSGKGEPTEEERLAARYPTMAKK